MDTTELARSSDSIFFEYTVNGERTLSKNY